VSTDSPPTFRLLDQFAATFGRGPYKHRSASLGNKIGRELFEDLVIHHVSSLLLDRTHSQQEVLTMKGEVYGRKRIRRNDSFSGRPPAGELDIRRITGRLVSEGVIAEPHIGCEVKIAAKAQQKQIDRVLNDLRGFGVRMRSLHARCINVAVVGVNHEATYVSYEGKRRYRHPLRPNEALETVERIREIENDFDEVLVLSFRATNVRPFPFEWVDEAKTRRDYGAILTRVGSLYDERFPL
jgi:hypothetical protein